MNAWKLLWVLVWMCLYCCGRQEALSDLKPFHSWPSLLSFDYNLLQFLNIFKLSLNVQHILLFFIVDSCQIASIPRQLIIFYYNFLNFLKLFIYVQHILLFYFLILVPCQLASIPWQLLFWKTFTKPGSVIGCLRGRLTSWWRQ